MSPYAMSMAIHPPTKTWIAALNRAAQPSFTPKAPNPANANVEVTTMDINLYLVLEMKEPANNGTAPPMAKATANAAHSKLESSSMSIPSSSCTCTYNAPPLVSSSATCRQSGPMILSILKSLLQLFFQYVPTIHMLPFKHHKVEYATLRSSCPEPLWNNDGNPRIHITIAAQWIK